MITLPELVALLYQADWKRLSLLARISWARDREAHRRFRLRSQSDLQRRAQTMVTRLTGLRDPDEPSPGSLEQESQVRLAPGGRFRVEAIADGTVAAIGDGEDRWALIADRALRRPGEGPGGALHGLLTPQWLLARYDLEVTGAAEVAGRPAQPGRAVVRRTAKTMPGTRRVLLPRRAHHRPRRLDQDLERRRPALHLDQDRRPDHRPHLPLLLTHL